MFDLAVAEAIFDTIPAPIVFVDNEHVVRYNNAAAIRAYCHKRGLETLVGQPIFDCHNGNSARMIRELHARLLAGEETIDLYLNSSGEQVTVVAVRDRLGRLLGYYERFTPTGKSP